MEFFEISEEVRDVLDFVINKTDILNYINVKYYAVNKQKNVIKVSKLNDVGKAVSKCHDTLVFTVNEEVFEKLERAQQEMIIEDVVSQIKINTENMIVDGTAKIKIEAPEIMLSVSSWAKYGEKLVNAYEACSLVLKQIKYKEKAEKEEKSQNKKHGKKEMM